MRITIGHILILAGVGTYVVLNPPKKFDTEALQKAMSSVVSNANSLMDLFKSGAQTSPTINPPAVEEKIPQAEVPPINSAVPPASATNTVSAPTAPTVLNQKAEPKVAVAPATPKKAARTRRSKRTKVAKASSVKDPLVGNYVTLTLDSGREIRGILEERTATTYKIQLPGMGPFVYQANKVKSVKASQ